MSRYGFEREENRENAARGPAFAPPSYEQACATVTEIGFKRDVQFTPIAQSSGSDERDERVNLRDECGELDDVPTRHKLVKQCCIAISILAIIIALLIAALIVSGRISRCRTEPVTTDNEYETKISYLEHLHERCTQEKERLQGKFTSTMTDSEIKELINYRRDSERQKSDLNAIISGLRDKLNQLTSENEKLNYKLISAHHNDDEETTKPISTSLPFTTTTTKDFGHFPRRTSDSINSMMDLNTVIKILMEEMEQEQKRIFGKAH